ncbi:translation initiation factor 2 [Pseudomonas brassicae]|uniref:translation initiation factor 2 n=1 Tax=Pseudomonas brassicae TaxID=2708063 RepID=UPI0015B417D9|nr:translation initiation factor 2 [Pseudomonas brassicae]
MNALRCTGVVLLCVLGLARPALAVPVVAPVLLAQSSAQPAAAKATPSSKAAAKPKPKPKPKSKPVVRKKAPAKAAKSGKRNASEVIAAPLPKARLDLSLPPEMVKELQPPGQLDVQARRPLLPALFQDKPASDSPFQLNGRLLSNEMQLQLRNDSRQDVEGAAIDFEFKQ